MCLTKPAAGHICEKHPSGKTLVDILTAYILVTLFSFAIPKELGVFGPRNEWTVLLFVTAILFGLKCVIEQPCSAFFLPFYITTYRDRIFLLECRSCLSNIQVTYTSVSIIILSSNTDGSTIWVYDSTF